MENNQQGIKGVYMYGGYVDESGYVGSARNESQPLQIMAYSLI